MFLPFFFSLFSPPALPLASRPARSHARAANADVLTSGTTYAKFFAPWCGHCKNMAADWETLSNTIKDVTVAEVDCTQADAKALCTKYGVRGYPTLKLFKDGYVYNYNRPRKVNDWLDFVQKDFYLQDNVEKTKL